MAKKETQAAAAPIIPDVTVTPEVDADPWEDDGLTGKQRMFVQAYVGPAAGNATRAAAMAGYRDDNRKSLEAVASKTLHKGNVQRAIARLVAAKLGSPDWVKAGIIEIANGNAADFLKPNAAGKLVPDLDKMAEAGALGLLREIKQEGIGDGEGEITVVKQTFRLYDRLRALELLAKINGQLTERHEHSGSVMVTQDAQTHAAMSKLMNDPEAMGAALLLADRLKTDDPPVNI
jgi:hypothetical protein